METKLEVGDKVRHAKYGVGEVIEVICKDNYAIRFSKGGPLGWAKNSTNDIEDLKLI